MTVRLHTGDPCVYGAIREQMDELDKLNISYKVCPGVQLFLRRGICIESGIYLAGRFAERDYHPDGGGGRRCRRGRASRRLQRIMRLWLYF